MKPTFQQWLLQQTGRKDSIGDLARDVSLDLVFLRKRFGLVRLLDRLEEMYAPGDKLAAAWDAKVEFDKGLDLPSE